MSCVYLCIIVIVKRDKIIAKKYFIYLIFFEWGGAPISTPEASEMALETGPRVEVQMRATRICYLSGNPRFDFVVLLTLHNGKEPVLFLKNGLQDITQFQSINSDQIVQCIDNDTGEQLQILCQGPKPSYLRLEPNRRGYVTFTTCDSPEPYELAFDTSSLLLDHHYRLRFN